MILHTTGRLSRTTVEITLATAAIGAYNYASLGVFALAPSIRTSLGLSLPEIGLLSSLQFLTAAALSFPAAGAVDRIASGRIVATSQLVVASAMAVAAAATSLPLLLVASASLGIASALVNPVTNVLSAGVISARRRGVVMSVKQTGVTLAGAIAGLTLPPLADRWSWRIALVLPAVVAVLVGFWGACLRAAGPTERLVLQVDGDPIGRFRIGIFGFMMSGVQLAIFGYVAIYLVDARGATTESAGVRLAVMLCAGGVGRIGWGIVSDRVGSRVTVLRAIGLGSVAALALLPIAGAGTVWAVLIALGVCSVGWNGVFHAMVAESAGAAGVARATASAFVFLYAGSIVVPPALGALADRSSWKVFWWFAAAIAVVAVAEMRAPSPQLGSQSAATVRPE